MRVIHGFSGQVQGPDHGIIGAVQGQLKRGCPIERPDFKDGPCSGGTDDGAEAEELKRRWIAVGPSPLVHHHPAGLLEELGQALNGNEGLAVLGVLDGLEPVAEG